VQDLRIVNGPAAPNALRADVRGFFEAFVDAFGSFDGARIAALYCVPHVALRADASIQCMQSRAEVERFFQAAVDGYAREGCRACRFTELDVVSLGECGVLGTVTWELLGDDGRVLRTWRQSYNLLRNAEGWRVFASTYHAGSRS
jgi:ketosteroid isomerase-like protein